MPAVSSANCRTVPYYQAKEEEKNGAVASRRSSWKLPHEPLQSPNVKMNTLKHGSSRDNPANSQRFSEQTLTRNKARADRSSVYPNQTQEERSLRRRSLSHPSESFAPLTISSLRVPLVLSQKRWVASVKHARMTSLLSWPCESFSLAHTH
ncbi:hypothetical protein CH63R_05682 [Colletotrichum higginsianum IMI 349063]|uniref:Uncharacterized protein n=1 Tax=Colletotrichum higginsianum (strain IMI 349063) TaxID=759273 RepID=A0A1B7YDL5_COLHI|nr:hypothetical protein CH63R_05682 [Colletotrichum higginsianum IMI 349063]OBR09990.1 hypothetical protein CH63R_05682 [Colletotrichum higginsianum IMI 349063]